jgi:hypothetical protein
MSGPKKKNKSITSEMAAKIIIETKNNFPEELKTKALLEEVLAKYLCPIFTDRVTVEKDIIPHSHPVLTIKAFKSGYSDDKFSLILLEDFLHEQFHWFFELNKNKEACEKYLASHYEAIDEPRSSGEHLAVIWNVQNYLKIILNDSVKMDFIYGLPKRVYPKTEKFVADNFEQLRQDLEKFGMAYKGEDLRE